MTEKRQTSKDYTIRILQHFATKLCNITNFVMLFQALIKFLSTHLLRLKNFVYFVSAQLGANFATKLASAFQYMFDEIKIQWKVLGAGNGLLRRFAFHSIHYYYPV